MSSECFVYFRIAWPNFVLFLGTKTVASERRSWNEWNGLWKPTKQFQLFVIHVRLITYARQHTRRTIQSHPLWFLIRIFGWFRQVSWLRWFGIKLHTRCAQSKWTEYSAAPFLFQTLSTAALQITRVFLRLRACCAAAPQMCMRGIVAALIKWWQNTAVAETEFVRLSTIVIDESGHACIC